MQNSFTTGPSVRILSGWDPVNGFSGPSVTNDIAWTKLVSPASMNYGNRIDPTPWSYLTKFSQGRSGYWREDDAVNKSWTLISGQYDSGTIPDTAAKLISESVLYNEALSRLNKRVRGELDLSVSAFQAKQTIRMFNVLESLDNFVRRKTSILRRVGSKWLEWQYGWKPLISDIYSVADETLRFNLNESEVVQGGTSRKFSSSTSVAGIHPPLKSLKTKYDVFQGVKIKLLMSTRNGVDLARWTSLNPVSIAWELLPYSFVVDWFYDIGGMLRAAETAMLYSDTFKSGCYSSITSSTATSLDSGSVLSSGTRKTWALRSYAREVRFNRTVLLSYPFPRLPTFAADLSVPRLLSSAALLAQKLR